MGAKIGAWHLYSGATRFRRTVVLGALPPSPQEEDPTAQIVNCLPDRGRSSEERCGGLGLELGAPDLDAARVAIERVGSAVPPPARVNGTRAGSEGRQRRGSFWER